MARLPRLVTLLPSTDVDLGRWLLSHYGQSYSERPHAPIFHVLALKWCGVGAEDYPLYIDGKLKLGTVDKILMHLEEQAPPTASLLPDADNEPQLRTQVNELQHYARWTVGGAVVKWSYWNLLKYKSAVWPSITTGVPWYEKLTCLIAFPLIRALMYKGLKLDQAEADAALKSIYDGFDKIDAMLADGREYLIGGRLTYADLAVAASLAPMVLAQGYQGMLPNQAACPEFMQNVYRDLRQRPTGLFIQRIYDTYRRA